MSEMSDRRDVMPADIELALLTDPTLAGWVSVDLEGINPRIITHTEDRETSAAYAERLLAIFRALYGEFRADQSVRLRGMKFQINTAVFTGEQRRAARLALAARLAEAGCSDDEVNKLMGTETISEYAARVIGDDPIPAARIPRPRKRQPPPRPAVCKSDGDD
ncbi:hypothetical protein [Sulfitobacter pontiacus]|uniref:hypothetical protein n=1 Tax=Sulfitobacter pontiacus TaxID=60137 RepID=UPI00315AE134